MRRDVATMHDDDVTAKRTQPKGTKTYATDCKQSYDDHKSQYGFVFLSCK